MMMTNGLGATIGSFAAQFVVNRFTHPEKKIINGKEVWFTIGDWSSAGDSFAGFALVVAILFAILFKYKHNPEKKQ